MIDQTSGLSSTVQNDRLYRDNSVSQAERRQPVPEQNVNSEQQNSDTVSLSAEAIALFRDVPPTGASSEVQESPAPEVGNGETSDFQRAGSIDIRV